MKNIFIINGGQTFSESGGKLNATITKWTARYFENKGSEVKITDINDSYIPEEEVQKHLWADLIIFHIPIWWFQVPYKLKEYIDIVLEEGADVLYVDDGRSRKNSNPKLGYGSGGALHGRKYMVTTTWNAPIEAFTTEGEIFFGKTPDDVLFGVHATCKFLGIEKLESFDFYDVMKEASVEKLKTFEKEYIEHLSSL